MGKLSVLIFWCLNNWFKAVVLITVVFFLGCASRATTVGRTIQEKAEGGKYQEWLIQSWQQQEQPWRESGEALSEITEVVGAIFDSETGWPVSISPEYQKESFLSPLALDDMMRAIVEVRRGNDPGVSIEPEGGINPFAVRVYTSPPSTFTVRYIPDSLKDTHLGYLLFEADRTLKPLCLGKDNLTQKVFNIAVPGYEPISKRMRGQVAGAGFFAAPIFTPKYINLHREQNSVWFEGIVMGVQSQSSERPAEEFVRHLEDNFDLFAKRLASLQELVRVTKLVAIARWLHKDVRGVNWENLAKYKPVSFPSPASTPTVTAEVAHWQEGPWIKIAVLCGGVLLSTPNTYLRPAGIRGEPVYVSGVKLGDLEKIVLAARPNKSSMKWNIFVSGQRYKAVALPLRR